MDALTVEVTERAGALLVVLSGELDEDTAATVRDLDVSGAGHPDRRRLELDLGGLEFMDSSGIGALVSLRNRAASLDLTTTVVSAPVHIRHTFAVAGLADLFGVRP